VQCSARCTKSTHTTHTHQEERGGGGRKNARVKVGKLRRQEAPEEKLDKNRISWGRLLSAARLTTSLHSPLKARIYPRTLCQGTLPEWRLHNASLDEFENQLNKKGVLLKVRLVSPVRKDRENVPQKWQNVVKVPGLGDVRGGLAGKIAQKLLKNIQASLPYVPGLVLESENAGVHH